MLAGAYLTSVSQSTRPPELGPGDPCCTEKPTSLGLAAWALDWADKPIVVFIREKRVFHRPRLARAAASWAWNPEKPPGTEFRGASIRRSQVIAHHLNAAQAHDRSC